MDESRGPFFKLAKQRYEPKELERLGLSPEPELRELILAYIGLVLRENRAAELLPEADEKHLFLRHFCDSLQPLLLFGFKKSAVVLDINSGGGFPSIPIRLFRPDLSFMLVEPCRKKADFLEAVKTELTLDNIEVYHGKTDSVKPGKKADYVIGRGVGSLQKFAQAARPFLADDGHMYTYKTKQFAAELETMTSNKAKDGIQIREIAQYSLGSLAQGLSLVSMEFV
ncbi:MAG: 16S rRNA (guanine(527)-N(7))-methyltransferase RsmG [Chitinispirillia bacterium]|nr:16S rRNA (guanine(527)-N(7))-methyltransferase RsmG [Chitinispirillia bacterium]MCL2241888.1 16S rRNA (guanine(527)-N(7))-methyltransferase RsmG [Chitinispirillia bacterium]